MAEVAGALYRTGTINVIQSNATVAGVGTFWLTDLIAVAQGDLLTLDFKTWYEILAVGSDTGIILDRGFENVSGSEVSYAILRNTSGTTATRLAGQIAKQFNQKQLLLNQWQTWTNSANATENITDSHNNTLPRMTISGFESRANTAIASVEAAEGNFDALDANVTTLISTVATIQSDLDADKVATNADAAQTALDRIATGSDKTATNTDAAQVALDRIATNNDKTTTNADAAQTALDRAVTEPNAIATGSDKVATNADAVQTALDRIATGNDKTATNADTIATAADRVQTGSDKAEVLAAKAISLANANFKGEWSSLIGPLNIPASTKDDGTIYMLLNNVADVTLNQPSLNPSDWFVLGVIGSSAPNADKLGDQVPAYYATAQSVIDLATLMSNLATLMSNIDNTSDINKPISAATQTALNLKANATDISNIDNTSDLAKPLSTEQQSALNLKANINSPTFTGTVGGINKTMVGLENVDNTSDATKQAATLLTAKKSDVDLGNVDNTSDLNKPISNDVKAVLDTIEIFAMAGMVI